MIRIIDDQSVVQTLLMNRLQCLRDVVTSIGQDVDTLIAAQANCCPSSSSSSSSSSGIIEDNMQFGDGNPVEWSGYP